MKRRKGSPISGGIQPRHGDKGKGNGCNTQRNKTQMKEKEQSNEIKECGIQTQEASRWVTYPKMKEEQNPYRAHLYYRKKTNENKTPK